MKKVLFFLIFFVLTILFLFFYKTSDKKAPFAAINNRVFTLEIARTDKDRAIGLSKYNNIKNDFGMLFPFGKQGYYSFWMKNMKFPIDIVFIRNGRIVKIFSNVPPPKSEKEPLPIYKPGELSDTVLEINAGLSGKYNLKNGNTVEINYR